MADETAVEWLKASIPPPSTLNATGSATNIDTDTFMIATRFYNHNDTDEGIPGLPRAVELQCSEV